MFFSFVIGALMVLLIWDYMRRQRRVEALAKAKIGGPKLYPLIGCREAITIGAENIIEVLGECFQKYGKTFRLWVLNEAQIFTTDMKYYEYLLNSNTVMKKGDLYTFLRVWINDGLLVSVGRKWHMRRKVFTPAFHFKVLDPYVTVFNEQSGIMAKQLEPLADGKTTVDMLPKVCLAALDVITETAMGVKVNAQSDPDFPYTKALKSAVYVVADRMFKPNQRSDWLFNLTAPKQFKKLINDIKIMHDFTIKVIEERRQALQKSIEDGTYKPFNMDQESDGIGRKKLMALLDILLQSSIDGKPLTNEDIREEVDTFMFEGDDTTTSSVSYALYLLSRHPEVQAKLFEEILQIVGNDKDAPLTIRQLQDLKYLDCVVKETLRLYPPVPTIGRKTEKDIEIDGKIIPSNTSIYMVLYHSHRDPEYFPDPEAFKPERFDDSVLTGPKRHPFSYVPFSAGPKNCIGQRFAMYEIKTLVSRMIRYYELLPSGPVAKVMSNLILRSSTGLNLAMKPRIYPS